MKVEVEEDKTTHRTSDEIRQREVWHEVSPFQLLALPFVQLPISSKNEEIPDRPYHDYGDGHRRRLRPSPGKQVIKFLH